jgi:hypothetical protein
VTIFSSKAEYVAISEAAKEIKFIYHSLKEIGVEVDLSITVKMKNIGAMLMVLLAKEHGSLIQGIIT